MVILAGRQAGSPVMSYAEYQRVYDSIINRVRSGELKPGERLPTIARMAESHGVSQTTLKFALFLLRRDGWVRGQQGKAVYISDNPPVTS